MKKQQVDAFVKRFKESLEFQKIYEPLKDEIEKSLKPKSQKESHNADAKKPRKKP